MCNTDCLHATTFIPLERGTSAAVVGKSAIEPGGRFVTRPYYAVNAKF